MKQHTGLITSYHQIHDTLMAVSDFTTTHFIVVEIFRMDAKKCQSPGVEKKVGEGVTKFI